jgi:hypothetical protein
MAQFDIYLELIISQNPSLIGCRPHFINIFFRKPFLEHLSIGSLPLSIRFA